MFTYRHRELKFKILLQEDPRQLQETGQEQATPTLPHATFILAMSSQVPPGCQRLTALPQTLPWGMPLLGPESEDGGRGRKPAWLLGSGLVSRDRVYSSEPLPTGGQRTISATHALGRVFKAMVDVGAAGLGWWGRVGRAGGHPGPGGLLHLLLQHQSSIDIRPCRGIAPEALRQGGVLGRRLLPARSLSTEWATAPLSREGLLGTHTGCSRKKGGRGSGWWWGSPAP